MRRLRRTNPLLKRYKKPVLKDHGLFLRRLVKAISKGQIHVSRHFIHQASDVFAPSRIAYFCRSTGKQVRWSVHVEE